MKKFNFLIILIGTLSSCVQDTTMDVSRVTNYPIITLNDDSVLFVEEGSTYIDAGAVSTEDGNEISTETSFAKGTYRGAAGVDTSKPDQYIVTYSAENADGFNGTTSRVVWVVPPTGDLVNSIEGLYTSDVQRGPSFTPSAQYDDLEYIFIWKISDNKYGISGAIGGYYDLGRGYGPAYAASEGTITVNNLATGDISFSGSPIPGFGINIVSITEFNAIPGQKMITFTADGDFGNGTFKVQLTQVQF